MELSVILSVRHGLELIDPCLYYLQQTLRDVDYEIIAVGHGLPDEVEKFLHQEPHVRIRESKPGDSPSMIWNAGYQDARGDTLLFMMDAVIFTQNTYRICQETLHRAEDVGAVEPYINAKKYCGCSANCYASRSELQEFADQVEAATDTVRRVLFLRDTCFLAKRSSLERSGIFDERFPSLGFEDIDLSMRMLQAGYRLLMAPTYVHCNPVTITAEIENRAFFYRKWGFDALYSTLSRTDVLELGNFTEGSPCILDIGCACGGTLAQIQELNPSSELYGIELNPFAAAIARNFGEIRAMDVEAISLPDWLGKFDCILMSDVVEHLKDPAAVLRNVAAMLKPDGFLLASIPNVLFIDNLKNMLQGRWHYEDQGILDRTHLRFFTRQSILDLFAEAHLEIDALLPKRGHITEELESLGKNLMAIENVSVTEDDLTAFQWLVRARR